MGNYCLLSHCHVCPFKSVRLNVSYSYMSVRHICFLQCVQIFLCDFYSNVLTEIQRSSSYTFETVVMVSFYVIKQTL